MINIALPESEHRRLPFFLAAEEWVAHNLPDGDYFFAWRVNPTVICGRHQEIDKEVNLGYCRTNGIDVVRRRSGGGAVFADRNNWMFSYITPGNSIDTTFSRYTSMIAAYLRKLGFNAEPTGRNDILIDGAKVAGNAFYHLPGRCIVHGTMLLDIDFEKMSNAITPERAKLESKGVKSVASRVTSLRAVGLTMSVEDFGKSVVNSLCHSTLTLSPAQIFEIEELEKRYYQSEFLKLEGRHSKADRPKRIEGVGTICSSISLNDHGSIESVVLSGDFFADSDRLQDFLNSLHGLSPNQLRQHILATDSPIVGLTPNELANIISE